MTGLTMRRLTTSLSAAFILAALPCISEAATIRRVSHTATLLTSGDILIAGGVDESETALASADIVAATRGSVIVAAGALSVARASHTATLMVNGCVLVAGGNTGAATPTASAEIYNPATNAWTSPGSLASARYNHTATLLNDGRVLICGGQDASGVAIPAGLTGSCEFYTPTSCTAGTFSPAPSLLQARYNHTAILLNDGKVWFAGGRNPAAVATGGYLPTTERYDPSSNAFQSASPLILARSQHTTTLMGDGKALIVGGYNGRDVFANTGITESAEIFDPISNSVTPAASMAARRHAHATTLSANGTVIVVGGLGNITTTYLAAKGYAFVAGSQITFSSASLSMPSMSITGGTAQIPLDFHLSKQVAGEIENGEIWLSCPTVKTAWGLIEFTPASETSTSTGLHLPLAGAMVRCDTSGCGSIYDTILALSQMQGQAYFSLRNGVALGGTVPPSVSAGTLNFSNTINATATTAALTAGGNFTTIVRIPMANGLIGSKIKPNSVVYLTDTVSSTLEASSSFTVTLTSGSGVIPVDTVVGVDGDGNGLIQATLTFTGLAGQIAFTGAGSQSFASGLSLPVGAGMTAALTGNIFYRTDGAVLTGETLSVGISTVVIRKMIFSDEEDYDPKTNSWSFGAGFGAGLNRYGHSATLLNNNDTIYYGGRTCQGATCATQTAAGIRMLGLVYSEKNFTNTSGQAAGKRAFHTTTLLPGGDLLVSGGTNGPSILNTAEIFNPATETFSPITGTMNYVRDLHTATLLPNGRVLIAGGFTTNTMSTGSTNTSEIYYPDTRRFVETSPMISSRSNHSAIMLPDGRVLVAGGFGPGDVITGTAEIYISTEGRWIPAATMPSGCERALHATVQLKNGKILFIGGINASGPLSSTARYDPAANSWDCVSVPAMPMALRSHTATLLFNGHVMVVGGNDGFGEANVSYIYDPDPNTWTSTDPTPLTMPRFNHTATLLPNGNVLITGGSQKFGDVPTVLETFHVDASSWAPGLIPLTFNGGPRAFHTMTLALNNKLYGIGGSNGLVGGTGVTLYNTAEAGYFTATPDAHTKNAPPSIRQSTIATTSATPFLPNTNLTITGNRFRGGTEASGGGAASANSAFSFPHLVMQQVDGSGGAASQSNGGFVVDLTTQIFLNSANFATLNTSFTVALPLTSDALPYGWYSLRTGANGLFSDGTLVQVGPAKPVTAPANIIGTSQGTSSMSWTWNAMAGIDGYNVYNATTGVFVTTVPVSGSPRYDQSGLDATSGVSILVAGYTLSGDGPRGASGLYYTNPINPINLTISSVAASNLMLSWGANGNSFPDTAYEITQSTDNFVNSLSTPVPQIFAHSEPFMTITSLSAHTTYYYRVRAFNPSGLPSAYSLIASTQTRTPATLPAVASINTTSIQWGWPAPLGISSYRVYNATDGFLIGTPVLNSFTQSGLIPNTSHSVLVSAVTDAGEGPLSASATVYTAAASPGSFDPPAAPTTGSLLISWSNNGNPLMTSYRVTLIEVASDGSVASTGTASTTGLFSLNFGGLKPSTLYRYTIVATNVDGIDSDTPPVVFGSTWTFPASPLPLAVIGTTPNSITVGWGVNNNTSSTTYQVTYSMDDFATNIATAIAFGANFKGTSLKIDGLITSATYSIRVAASNPFGQLSMFSNSINAYPYNGGAPIGSLQGPMLAASNSTLSGTLGNGRRILLRSPAHTFPSDVVVTISSFVPTGTLCPNATNIAFSIYDTPALQPIGGLYLNFDFTPAELGTIPANRALLLRYDPGSNTCVPLETTVDTASGQMTARINHFSLFQVGQIPLTNTPETARLFPNPYYAGRDGFVTIDNVPPGARVRIFTLRGEKVLDVNANSTGMLTWGGTNGAGRSVASGVYLVMAESGGTKKILKLAVIR